MFMEEVWERRKKSCSEDILVTLELVESKHQSEVDTINELNDTYSKLSFSSIFSSNDYQRGYDY